MDATPPVSPHIGHALTKCSKMCKFNFLSTSLRSLHRAAGAGRGKVQTQQGRDRGRCEGEGRERRRVRAGRAKSETQLADGSQQAITHMKSARTHHASCGSSCGINPKMKYPLALPA